MSSETPKRKSKDLTPSDTPSNTSLPKKNTIEDAVEETMDGFLMSMQSSSPHSSILSGLSPEQIDKMLKSADEAAKRKHEFEMAQLNANKQLEKDRISGEQIEKKTRKYSILILISAFLLVTLIILIFKDEFVDKWFTLIIGLIGGSGLTTIYNKSGISSDNKKN